MGSKPVQKRFLIRYLELLSCTMRECVRPLLHWLTLHTAFDAARRLPVPVVPAAKLLDLAAAAGYRLRSLLHLLAGGAAE